jgi:membrane protease YdiL (CAAX protease family)
MEGNAMKAWIRRHPLAAYLTMLYPLAFFFNLPALLGTEGLGVVNEDIPFVLGILPSTILGLGGLAFLVTAIADGKSGVRDLFRRFYALRVGPQWYLIAVGMVSALLFVVSLAMHGIAAFPPFGAHAPEFVTLYLQGVVTFALLINLTEECGWTAFVTERLQRRWGPLRTCFAVGPMMGAIHLPLLFVVGAVTVGARIQLKDLPLALFVLLIGYAIPFRIIITWVYNSTGRSLPIIALLHSSFDQAASLVFLGTFFLGLDAVWIDIIPVPVALAIVVITRGRLGYRPVTGVSPETRGTAMAMALAHER